MDYSVGEKLNSAGIRTEIDISLSEHSTFRIGGRCALAAFPGSTEELVRTVQIVGESGTRYTVVGNGSNLLFSDGGYDGVIVFTSQMNQISVKNESIYAEAGTLLSTVANTAMKNSLAGMEFAHGIPGSCGGAVFMNAGAYGGEMSGIVEYSEYYDVKNKKSGRFYGAVENGFAYRNSIFCSHPEYIITGVSLRLRRGKMEEIRALMDELKEKRRASQPLDKPSAGSAFKRPENGFAAKMIDDCGLCGYRVGNAAVSEKHAGFIVNLGGATAADVKALIGNVRNEVFDKFGVMLEPEIRFID